jgi:hypothetical protein
MRPLRKDPRSHHDVAGVDVSSLAETVEDENVDL